MTNRVWARLSDGTPLITARAAKAEGWIVDLPPPPAPTGRRCPSPDCMCDMLKRLLALSASTPRANWPG